MIDPAIGALLSSALALLFASTALHKLLDLERLAEVVRAYALVPSALARLSWLVPLVELAAGAGLLFEATRASAALAGMLLLLAYAAAITVNLHRGRRDLDCGCGGPNDRRPIAAWMVWRNLTLGVALSVLQLPWAARTLGAADALTIAAGTFVLALLYVSVDTLLGRVAPRMERARGAS
jgi:uncharacterized membrane protein